MQPLLRFSDFELDVAGYRLLRQGRLAKLERIPFDLLILLVQRPGELVTRTEIVEKLWGKDVFLDADTSINTAVRKLRRVLRDNPEKPSFIETVPQRGYRFIAPVEIQSAEPPHVSPETHGSWRRPWVLPAVGAAVAVLALIFGVSAIRERIWPPPQLPVSSLAVLPLQNLSQDPEQEYFADGMTDELITEIAKISSLRVISRTSIMQYKGSGKSLPEIAKELRVDAVVEGSVLRAGQKVRITAQLIHARDDRHVWADKFERSLSDVLALQSEVAQAIALQIHIKLTPQEQTNLRSAPRVNPEAHEAYLRGIYFLEKGTERLDSSVASFIRAVELSPNYARAYGGLSQAYIMQGIYGLRPPQDVYPKARSAAQKALSLDETVAEAHMTLADVKKGYDWDFAAAESEYKRGLELNPSSAMAHAWYADYLSKIGRWEESLAEAKRSYELDPVSPARSAFLANIYYRANRYDEAIAASRQALELDPNYPNALWFLALTHEVRREIPEAIRLFQKASSLSKSTIYPALLGHAYAVAGEKAKALEVLEGLTVASQQGYVSPVDFALVYTGLGDRNSAFRWLERAYQERTMRIQELPQPHFAGLRSDPRFADLMRRIGLPN